MHTQVFFILRSRGENRKQFSDTSSFFYQCIWAVFFCKVVWAILRFLRKLSRFSFSLSLVACVIFVNKSRQTLKNVWKSEKFQRGWLLFVQKNKSEAISEPILKRSTAFETKKLWKWKNIFSKKPGWVWVDFFEFWWWITSFCAFSTSEPFWRSNSISSIFCWHSVKSQKNVSCVRIFW